MSDIQGHRRLWLRAVLGALLTMALATLAVYGLITYRAYQYPFGWSHCCDKQLAIALYNYADEHAGKYPTGGATPEASLSLLYPTYADGNVLRGKIVPLDVAERQLESGQPLTADTCGWHYEDGLVSVPGSMGNVAILRDKVGLDHNGGRLPHGGHSVVFMGGFTRVIRESDWQRFLAEQQNAWKVIRQGGAPAKDPWLPDDW